MTGFEPATFLLPKQALYRAKLHPETSKLFVPTHMRPERLELPTF